MSEKPVCHRCGYVGPVDARYCAYCGHALGPPNVRLTRGIRFNLSKLSPLHIGFLGLVLSVPISVFAARLIVTEFSFPLSVVPLALVIGCGYAYLGWHWNASLPSRSHLVRILLVLGCIAVCLVGVWLADRGLLGLMSDRTHKVVYEVPGVYRESSVGVRHISIESNVPPYWLVAIFYAMLCAIAGNLTLRAHKRRSI